MSINFVSLHNQTCYSLLDALSEPKELIKKAKQLGQPAIALTEHGSFASLWEAWKVAKEEQIKLIVGCEVYFMDQVANRQPQDKLRHLILLAKNAVGYKNLLTLNKKAFDQGVSFGKKLYPVVDWQLLDQYKEGLICLTACGNGILSQLLMTKQTDKAEQALLKLKEMFGEDLGIEVQPNNLKRNATHYNDEIDQTFLNRQLINLANKHSIKAVAACNSHYVNQEDYDAHDVLLAIGSHQPKYSNFRLKYPVQDFYLKSGDEVKKFFLRNYGEQTAQELCDNSVYFANLCEDPIWVDPKHSNPSGKELPIFPVKDEPDYQVFLEWLGKQEQVIKDLSEDSAYLRFKCFKSFDEKFKLQLSLEKQEEYNKRIEKELDVLNYQGFSSYMLIVSDFLSWAKRNEVPCGPGRGSGSGSMIGYLLDIHLADPIKYDLIFERFQTKGKISFPDIDVDVGTNDRHKVIEYIQNKYGIDYVAHISNLNTITPKIYVRDMARTCEFGGSKEDAIRIGNEIADIIPNTVKSKAELENIPLYGEYIKQFPQLAQYNPILGQIRNFSTHAGATVIGARPLVGLVPVRKDKDGAYAIEYEKNDTEENGLLKMDILGLTTLDIIADTNRLIKQAGKEASTIDYDLYDQKTYDLITAGNTYGVFQFGTSTGTIDLCKKIKPKTIDDLSIITTLARPAAADIRTEFIETREGKRPFNLLHPSLKGAFEKTFGFGLYDESILRLGSDVAGWDLNEADRLRKMIKEKGKNPEKDKKLRQEFIDGAIKQGINKEMATNIWDVEINKFRGYTFCHAHATTYSMVSYHTAFLKANFPIEFLLANLMMEVKSNSPMASGNIAKIKKEIRAHKVKIVPPNINKSQLTYVIEDGNKLITGLDALKFVGEDAIKEIIEKRPFNSFFDFMSRIDSKKVRANNIQALVGAGALDDFKLPRKAMFLYVSDYRKKLQVWMKKHDASKETFHYPWAELKEEWTKSELYALEQFYMGEGFSCKPYQAYGQFFDPNHFLASHIKKAENRKPLSSIRGIVRDCFEFKVKKESSKYYGKAMVKAMIEDKNGEQFSCTIFPDKLETMLERIKQIHKKAILEAGLALHFSGYANEYEENMGVIFDQLFDISLVPERPADLKAHKINLKATKVAKEEDLNQPKDLSKLKEELEDDLINQGFLDLDNSKE